MKNVIKGGLVLVVVLAVSAFTVAVEKKEVKLDQSKVTWKGYKVTGSHHGSIALKSGHLLFEEGKLSGGEFVADVTTLNSEDLTGEYKGKLEGHLKSPDFFGVETYPEAKLVFTKVVAKGKNSYEATADLTIKDVTKSVSFPISIYGSKATATLKIDRTDYGLKYGSASFFDSIGDKAIYDEFDLVVDLEF